jgi:hypothetical protein
MECYMKWVTNNVDTFVRNEKNLVACVSCKEIYETKYFRVMHNGGKAFTVEGSYRRGTKGAT